MQPTVHANLGSWLEAQQEQHHVPILATPTAHPASVLFFGRAAVSFGALTVVLVVGCFLPYHLLPHRGDLWSIAAKSYLCRAGSKQMRSLIAAFISSNLFCKTASAKVSASSKAHITCTSAAGMMVL